MGAPENEKAPGPLQGANAREESHKSEALTNTDCRRLLAALNVLETERLAAEWGAQIAETLGERVLARGGG